MLRALKNRLLKAGPNSAVVFQAFRLQALMRGIRLRKTDGVIVMTKGRQRILLSPRDTVSVPFVGHLWKLFFDTIEGVQRGECRVLDFSQPALHRYRRTGLSFFSPSIAEDDCMDAYQSSYRPAEGDIVWDVGAYAGMTTFMFAKMVGPTGRVIAFEPDDTNFDFLLRNIELHKLENVVPVKAALSDETGMATFCMDGTMSAGLTKTLANPAQKHTCMVETMSPQDACKRYGGVPQYIKMDIEGAELSVVPALRALLQAHPIHMVIESHHVVNGRYTAGPLPPMLHAFGYRAWSSTEFRQWFTWAEPPAAMQTAAGAIRRQAA